MNTTILHTALHIAGDDTGKEFSMKPEYEIIGDECCGRVNYAIKEQNAVDISAQSNTSIPKSPIHLITSQSSISPYIEGISKQSDYSDNSIEKNNADPISQDFDSIPLDQANIPSVVGQYDTTESKSLEDDRETDSFLDKVHKKKASNEIRERKQKRKLQHELTAQDSSCLILPTH
ncbi:hypothetical protein RhiirB3_500094 [Rhizophagus irregularis]|nr:hypothetical protein RhiirB3_500094 [Rhizophagus irregularis]